jgi:N-acetylneuraminate lyase
MIKIEKYTGLIAAPFTPMDHSGNLNTGMIPEYYNFLEKNGVTGAFINGSTGEGPSLTTREKQLQTIGWMKCRKAGGKVKILNMIGGTSYSECIESAIFSREEGVSAIALVAPYYYKPANAGMLAEYVAKVGEAVPEMPLYFYHIPSLTGVNIPMIGFLQKISAMLPNFAGIKYTQEDLLDFHQCLVFANGKYDMLWGRDECLLSAFIIGCRGVIGSTYNYAAPLYNAIIKAFNAGNLDEARRLQFISVEIVKILIKYGGLPAGKAYMKYLGMDCGRFRLPVGNLSDKEYDEFVKDVTDLKIDEYFSR